MHDLIAKGVAEARQRKGWTQERTAHEFRLKGLSSWRKGTVGQLEAGLRKPRLDEVLLMCRALEISLEDLIPGQDEHVDMGDGAVMTPQGIRELLSGDYNRFDSRPVSQEPYERFPETVAIYEYGRRALAKRDWLDELLTPIRQWCDDHNHQLPARDYIDALRPPTDAERHAARRLDVDPAQVKLASRVLWNHRDFGDERDARIGDTAALAPRSLQARRGLVTRQMLDELRTYLAEVYRTGSPDAWAPAPQPVVAAIVTSGARVLITARRDGRPPWGFVTGEVEPGEFPQDAAIREVKEETGLEVRISAELGERDHPQTGRHMYNYAAEPVRGTDVFVGDDAELSEVRWASLNEAQDLMPGMFVVVRDYLAAILRERPLRKEDGGSDG